MLKTYVLKILMFEKLIKSVFGKRTGETLVEVITAIFVVAIGSGSAAVLLTNAIQANSFSRDNLIALNLAVEGAEAIRNVRDTNWIRFGYDKANCWNLLPSDDTAPDCLDADNLISTGNYVLNLNPGNYSWEMKIEEDDVLNLRSPDAQDETFRLGIAGIANSDTRLIISYPFIVSKLVAPDYSNEGETKFYRMVHIDYEGAGNDIMNVISVVQWRAQGRMHEVIIPTKLANYEKIRVGT